MHPNLLGTLNVSRHIIDKYRFLPVTSGGQMIEGAGKF